MTSPMKRDEYDVVIVGGGTAGCVLAARLTEDPDTTVLVIEAGKNMNKDFFISTPGLLTQNWSDPEKDWSYTSEPNPGLNNRRMEMPAGKCLGGGSAINVMCAIYTCGASIDAWGELGSKGWSWKDLAPYYRKFQTAVPPSEEVREALGLDYLDPSLQGTDGPVKTSFPKHIGPMEKAWIDTWKGLKKQITGDPLSGRGVGGYCTPSTVDPETATRSHAGVAFLEPAMERKNLQVITEALVQRLVLEKSAHGTLEAKGATFIKDGVVYTAKAKKETIVSAGVFASPKILELSGIGSRDICKSVGIEHVLDLPGVGENLQDHLMGVRCFETNDGVPTADAFRDPAVVGAAIQAYQTQLAGPLASPPAYAFCYAPLSDFLDHSPKIDIEGLFKTYLDEAAPPKFKSQKVQYDFIRKVIESPDEATATFALGPSQLNSEHLQLKDIWAPTKEGNFVSVIPGLAHPFSRGRSHIKSADAQVYPKIEMNYLEHPLDLEILARHMLQVETLMRTPPMCNMLKPNGRRLPEGYDSVMTLEEAKELVKAGSITNYHPSGTCAMMPEELGGVVNERLLVYGTKRLRVVDASIFPIEPRGNIMTTVYAVAEKAADMIKEDLRGESAPVTNGCH